MERDRSGKAHQERRQGALRARAHQKNGGGRVRKRKEQQRKKEVRGQCAPKRTEDHQLGTRRSVIAGIRAEDYGSSSLAERGSCSGFPGALVTYAPQRTSAYRLWGCRTGRGSEESLQESAVCFLSLQESWCQVALRAPSVIHFQYPETEAISGMGVISILGRGMSWLGTPASSTSWPHWRVGAVAGPG